MAVGFLLLLLLALARPSGSTWCVCNSGANSSALQVALDYACGNGADCTPIQASGACYIPNTVLQHCSFAVNSYFQMKGQASETCDFSGTATTTSSDPSPSASCSYASSTASSTGNTTTSPPPPSGILSPGPAGSNGTGIDGRGGRLLSPATPPLFFAIVLSGLLLAAP